MNLLLIGGTGFLGSHLAAVLAAAGHRLTLPTRRRERAKHLALLPTVEVVEADVHNPATLARLCRGQDAVFSLVGILKGGEGDPYGAGFARAHVELPQKVAAACRAAGVPRLIHVSALKAAADAPSGYLRSKAAGETAVLAAQPEVAVTIVRPSVIFGRGDSFLTLFAGLLKMAPLVPLACPAARFQPVWMGDVTTVLAACLERTDSHGRAYDLCGPRVYSLRELVAYAGRVSGHPRPILGLPDFASWLQAWAMEFVPGGPMTRDNVRSMRLPSICDSGCALPFGIEPTPLEAVAPGYLGPAA
ncbi:MAG: complex I NDUFA9 subunit family protein [Sterolibacteriaceae bacterium MAG5]|nr:complex I NDUFA9 subunit family protein [Candidatus Nitricoxidireducens bremensis]